MDFIHPAEQTAIPTYRVMDSDGLIVDTSREPTDLDPAEVVTWYKNMVAGLWKPVEPRVIVNDCQ